MRTQLLQKDLNFLPQSNDKSISGWTGILICCVIISAALISFYFYSSISSIKSQKSALEQKLSAYALNDMHSQEVPEIPENLSGQDFISMLDEIFNAAEQQASAEIQLESVSVTVGGLEVVAVCKTGLSAEAYLREVGFINALKSSQMFKSVFVSDIENDDQGKNRLVILLSFKE